MDEARRDKDKDAQPSTRPKGSAPTPVHNSEIAEIFERWQSIWLSWGIPNALRRLAACGLGAKQLRQRDCVVNQCAELALPNYQTIIKRIPT